jgi:uncharacterized membrane protein YebE (DUF533 family)
VKAASIVAVGVAGYLGYQAWSKYQAGKYVKDTYTTPTVPVVTQSIIDEDNKTMTVYLASAGTLLALAYFSR